MTITEQDEVIKFLNSFEAQSKAIKEEALRICWWMRGSLSYDEAMQLSVVDRDIIQKIIKENVESGKKAGIPIF